MKTKWSNTKSTRHIGAMRKGFIAQRKGLSESDCPYEDASMWKYWRIGYNYAKENPKIVVEWY